MFGMSHESILISNFSSNNGPPPGASAAAGRPGSSGRPGSAGGNNGSSSSNARLPGIGGLFADGIPKLKKTQGGIATGRSTGAPGPGGGAPDSRLPPTPQNTSNDRNYFNQRTSNPPSSMMSGNSASASSNSQFSQSSLVSSLVHCIS